MKKRIFGTDGVRGIANKNLTCDLAFKLGQACVAFNGKTILVGKDTRLSGDMLESALAAGIMSMGGTVLRTGVIPTPAVALLVRELHCDGGVVISASHNPPAHNGIKLFNAKGFKLPDKTEDEIQAFVEAGGASLEDLPEGDAVGVCLDVDEASEMYIAHAVKTVTDQGISFDGMKIALDTGHGASSFTSPEALRRLGAEVVVINDEYNGTDINVECGSTCLKPLHALVQECGADVGIAHDGDADRVMLMDAEGNEIDGDMVEAVCALDLKQRGNLVGNTAVSTIMCNLGLNICLKEAGIELVQTKVGDRYVLEEMLDKGYVLGGEQSGHMIFLEHNSTGDGLVTALQFLAAVKRSGKSVQEAVSVMTKLPQTQINVAVADKERAMEHADVQAVKLAVEEKLGSSGRVVLRPSGTEMLVRVMVEAVDGEAAKRYAEEIAEVVRAVE